MQVTGILASLPMAPECRGIHLPDRTFVSLDLFVLRSDLAGCRERRVHHTIRPWQ